MSEQWQAQVRVWPFSTGNGAANDKAAVGAEFQTVTIKATTIREALAQAEVFVTGVRTNPAVWQANVVAVAQVRP